MIFIVLLLFKVNIFVEYLIGVGDRFSKYCVKIDDSSFRKLE